MTTATVRTYAVDPSHSSVGFSVRHLMIAKVRGTFNTFKGTIQLPADSPIPTVIQAEIDPASIDTREEQRDTHLKSADFLDVATHSQILFESSDIQSAGGTEFTATGNLTIHGVTKPVTLKGEVSGQGTDPWGNARVAFEASTRINRKDFDLNWNSPLEAGGVLIGEEVDITLDIQAIPAPQG
jgi:polyisoprenoid-binding protein YceI